MARMKQPGVLSTANFAGMIKEICHTLIWRTTGISHAGHDFRLTSEAIQRILICRPNHRLGNLLLITPLIQEVRETFPQAKIDLFVKGNLGSSIFKNYNNINTIIQLPRRPYKNVLKYLDGWWTIIREKQYDIAINVIDKSSSGRLSTQFANSKCRFFSDINNDIPSKYDDHEHMAKYPVYRLRSYLDKLGVKKSAKQIAPLSLELSSSEILKGKELLNGLVNNNKRTIGLFTYATGKKRYSTVWWEEFYSRIKSEYKEFNVIEVLPVENISQLSFKAPTFYSKDIRQIGSLIANIDVFISADGGMMHLASAVQTPTIGLFKVTNPNAYEPYNNKSVAVNTNGVDMDECVRILSRILQ